MDQNIGFIGLGNMGYPMAMNVRKKMPPSDTLYVYDVNEKVCDKFKEEFGGPNSRIEISKTIPDMVANASTIISMVPSPENVRQVYLDEKSGVAAAKGKASAEHDAQRLYCECSTIDIDTTRDVGKRIGEMGMGTYIDTPVSGGPGFAQTGTLSLMCGISESSPAAKRVDTIVKYMGGASKIFYCGSLGLGLAGKLSNNYISCCINQLNAEAMAFGIKLGLDKNLLYNIIMASSGRNWMLERKSPVGGVIDSPSDHDYVPGFRVPLALKDVSLGVKASKAVGIKPSIGEAVVEIHSAMDADKNYKDLDHSAVYRYLGGPE
ncbi:3-hydroxyisobutyrate dehydrogenase [Rhizodiscina lignyota]|uniref:3-hydroxyisobutyrate dehydrogenase n=1 Tax=Rhizodiscina lignyota TaxID=1504668 RepID=A0A9P4IHZ1_9PEZI|nr:3-hydroxyisobutyrate dehydrogenase [Rhizodiscina lignyota]